MPESDLAALEVDALRPVERRMRRLVRDGVTVDDIASRFHRSPDFVRRVLTLSELPGRHLRPAHTFTPGVDSLRPLERRILQWRDGGASAADIGSRFGRSAEHVERVETLARYKLSR